MVLFCQLQHVKLVKMSHFDDDIRGVKRPFDDLDLDLDALVPRSYSPSLSVGITPSETSNNGGEETFNTSNLTEASEGETNERDEHNTSRSSAASGDASPPPRPQISDVKMEITSDDMPPSRKKIRYDDTDPKSGESSPTPSSSSGSADKTTASSSASRPSPEVVKVENKDGEDLNEHEKEIDVENASPSSSPTKSPRKSLDEKDKRVDSGEEKGESDELTAQKSKREKQEEERLKMQYADFNK